MKTAWSPIFTSEPFGTISTLPSQGTCEIHFVEGVICGTGGGGTED